jgi:zinc finger SWIM domain-containing protein 3
MDSSSITVYVEWDETNQEIIQRKLVCTREEKHMKREDRKTKPQNLTRVGCRAKFVVARVKKMGL